MELELHGILVSRPSMLFSDSSKSHHVNTRRFPRPILDAGQNSLLNQGASIAFLIQLVSDSTSLYSRSLSPPFPLIYLRSL